MSFRDFYHLTLADLLEEEAAKPIYGLPIYRAKYRLRMYANLFTRDMRRKMINRDSVCAKCGTKDRLQIDHIIPIMRGGKNEELNVQILCSNCNRAKSDKI